MAFNISSTSLCPHLKRLHVQIALKFVDQLSACHLMLLVIQRVYDSVNCSERGKRRFLQQIITFINNCSKSNKSFLYLPFYTILELLYIIL